MFRFGDFGDKACLGSTGRPGCYIRVELVHCLIDTGFRSRARSLNLILGDLASLIFHLIAGLAEEVADARHGPGSYESLL